MSWSATRSAVSRAPITIVCPWSSGRGTTTRYATVGSAGAGKHELKGDDQAEDQRLTSARSPKPGDGEKRAGALEVFDLHLGHGLSASLGKGRGHQ